MADEKKVELVLDEIKEPEQKTVEKSKNKTEKPVKEKAAKPERPAKDVFVLGANLSLLKDSHLTRFRRDYVGFIFQQYNLLTNLTAKENAEVGENLSRQKHKDLTRINIRTKCQGDNNNVSQSHVPWLKTQKSFSGMNQLERLMKKWDDVFYKFLLILIKNTKQQLLLLLITRTSLILLTQLFMLKTDWLMKLNITKHQKIHQISTDHNWNQPFGWFFCIRVEVGTT
jgi:hypothetical protein